MLLFGRFEMFPPGGKSKTSKQTNGNLHGSESSENESHGLLYKTARAQALLKTGGGGACPLVHHDPR